jgi:hypothetical protein
MMGFIYKWLKTAVFARKVVAWMAALRRPAEQQLRFWWFPYVCPERVLPKIARPFLSSGIYTSKVVKKPVFLTAAPTPRRSLQGCKKTRLFLSFPLCLSRACLDKSSFSALNQKMAPKDAFSHLFSARQALAYVGAFCCAKTHSSVFEFLFTVVPPVLANCAKTVFQSPKDN